MLYCPKCSRLTEGGPCPSCARAKRLRPPRDDDPVLLLTARFLHASMLEPLLDEERIPHSKVELLGVGGALRLGTMLESYQFYVPYAAYARARELVAGIFANDEEIVRSLREAVGGG